MYDSILPLGTWRIEARESPRFLLEQLFDCLCQCVAVFCLPFRVQTSQMRRSVEEIIIYMSVWRASQAHTVRTPRIRRQQEAKTWIGRLEGWRALRSEVRHAQSSLIIPSILWYYVDGRWQQERRYDWDVTLVLITQMQNAKCKNAKRQKCTNNYLNIRDYLSLKVCKVSRTSWYNNTELKVNLK